MNRQQSLLAARALTDASDQLLTADDVLAELHESCGGVIPGTLAIPELLELVRQGRKMGLKLAREFSAFDGVETVSGFARVRPLSDDEGGGCEVLVENWKRAPLPPIDSQEAAKQLDEIDRASAEAIARLDASQRVQFLAATSPDLTQLEADIVAEPGKIWSDYIQLLGVSHHQPLHWRLLDGTQCLVPGSEREWRIRLLPVGAPTASPVGFELLLIAKEPLAFQMAQEDERTTSAHSQLFGSSLTPVLRQPITRIIANAETIRARLAGPLKLEYSEYAGNIASAGQHLSAMLDDLADLEVVEDPDFETSKERVDIADAARRAAGILGVRAQSKAIDLQLVEDGEDLLAEGEFRRVLQILINLIGNAIAYSPDGSTVRIKSRRRKEGFVSVSVTDQGPGVSADQATRIFEKFERLGRDSDGGNDPGSGLGLYISRKLALAMEGDLNVIQPKDGDELSGAKFRLFLPEAK